MPVKYINKLEERCIFNYPMKKFCFIIANKELPETLSHISDKSVSNTCGKAKEIPNFETSFVKRLLTILHRHCMTSHYLHDKKHREFHFEPNDSNSNMLNVKYSNERCSYSNRIKVPAEPFENKKNNHTSEQEMSYDIRQKPPDSHRKNNKLLLKTIENMKKKSYSSSRHAFGNYGLKVKI
ncbi:hypothetical protein CDAR_584901 [Caerostris darwini]|uniref:Uncharacterized protein n=1 Tax=Caerostris darwini TaxID=1538125 RepID=A0AAV4UDQ6_9ARAC|nr:hypothetical protein CDAR_584901 [Caerostris darwini]